MDNDGTNDVDVDVFERVAADVATVSKLAAAYEAAGGNMFDQGGGGLFESLEEAGYVCYQQCACRVNGYCGASCIFVDAAALEDTEYALVVTDYLEVFVAEFDGSFWADVNG